MPGLTEQVWMSLLTTIGMAIGGIVTVLGSWIAFQQMRLKLASEKTIAALARQDEASARQEEAIERAAKVADATHGLVNSQHENMLQFSMFQTRRIADLSGLEADREIAELAKKMYWDHVEKTKEINSQQPTGRLMPASLLSPPAPVSTAVANGSNSGNS